MNSGIGIIWAPVSAGTLVIWGLGIFVAVVGMPIKLCREAAR